MADLLITAGLDDRAFTAGLRRMEAQSERAGRQIDSAFRFGRMAIAGRVAFGIMNDGLSTVAKQSTEAAAKVDRITSAFDSLKASIGNDVINLIGLDTAADLVKQIKELKDQGAGALHDEVMKTAGGGDRSAGEAFLRYAGASLLMPGAQGAFLKSADKMMAPVETYADKQKAEDADLESQKRSDRLRLFADEQRKALAQLKEESAADPYEKALARIDAQEDAERRRINTLKLERQEREKLLTIIGETADARRQAAGEDEAERRYRAATAAERLLAERERLENSQIDRQLAASELGASDEQQQALELEKERLETARRIADIRRDANLSQADKDAFTAREVELLTATEEGLRRKRGREERAKDKYRSVDAASIADAGTLNQIVGAQFNPRNIAEAERVATQARQLQEAEEQTRLLESIDRGIREGTTAVYQ